MPPVPRNTASPPEQRVDDDRRARWVAKLVENRTFRASQIERLDTELASSPGLPSDTVTGILRDGACTALHEIDDAIARLVSGDFGRCLHCRQPIELERLDVLPMTSRCMPCQFDVEVGGR